MTIAEYLKRYDIDEHISKIVEVYRKRRDIALECIERYFPNDKNILILKAGYLLGLNYPKIFQRVTSCKNALNRK